MYGKENERTNLNGEDHSTEWVRKVRGGIAATLYFFTDVYPNASCRKERTTPSVRTAGFVAQGEDLCIPMFHVTISTEILIFVRSLKGDTLLLKSISVCFFKFTLLF